MPKNQERNIMKKIGIFICLILISGCASVHSGYYAKQIDQTGKEVKGKQTKLGLIVSGIENVNLSSTYFGVIDFTFENKSQEWIRIKSIKIDFGDDKINQNVKFTSGNDLAIWFESTKKRNIINDFNTEMVLGAIAGAGLGMAAASNNQKVQNIGTATAIGAAASLSAYEFNKSLDKIEKAEIFSENHLFAKEFVIPPGLFVKKWLLLNSKNHEETGYITDLFLEYLTENGDTERLKLSFRPPCNRQVAEWQHDTR